MYTMPKSTGIRPRNFFDDGFPSPFERCDCCCCGGGGGGGDFGDGGNSFVVGERCDAAAAAAAAIDVADESISDRC